MHFLGTYQLLQLNKVYINIWQAVFDHQFLRFDVTQDYINCNI